MSVKIRMSRQGSKNKPNYILVATDGTKRRDGGYIEKLGQYFPKATDPKQKLKVNREKVDYWVARGAQVSQTVGQLLKSLAK